MGHFRITESERNEILGLHNKARLINEQAAPSQTDKDKIIKVQQLLKTKYNANLGTLGPNKDGIDGVLGPKTLSALNTAIASKTKAPTNTAGQPAGGTTPPAAGATTPPAAGATTPPAAGPTTPPAAGPTTPPAAGPTTPPAAGPTTPPAAGPTTPPAASTQSKVMQTGEKVSDVEGLPSTNLGPSKADDIIDDQPQSNRDQRRARQDLRRGNRRAMQDLRTQQRAQQ